jgi:Zn-dependent protease with chaperone function/Tfp pilus assembly major pilin PilA
MEMVYKNEKPLFVIALVLSIIFWIILVVGTLGIALIYGVIFYIAYLFAQSGFISHIKGTGVKVSATQYPDLHARLLACCRQIGLDEVPDCYVLRTDTFNALATKFRGQHFVVLFSDVIDALKDDPEALNFYIGHELGHIHRQHLKWGIWLAPGRFLPLLGAAYSRACEYTCDRYGLACCASPQAAQRGLLAIGAADSRFLATDIESYVAQRDESAGFWMSFHELVAGYPWLTKRVASVKALGESKEVDQPRRSAFAYVLSFFVPNAGIGGAGSIIIVVAIIGILAAIAIPAYRDYTTRARVVEAISSAAPVREAVAEHILRNQKFPESAEDFGDSLPDTSAAMERGINITVTEGGAIAIEFSQSDMSGKSFFLVPYVKDRRLNWRCESETIPPKGFPTTCR